jgi:hypothetical protein
LTALRRPDAASTRIGNDIAADGRQLSIYQGLLDASLNVGSSAVKTRMAKHLATHSSTAAFPVPWNRQWLDRGYQTINPGLYAGGMFIEAGAAIALAPGAYFVIHGDFSTFPLRWSFAGLATVLAG